MPNVNEFPITEIVEENAEPFESPNQTLFEKIQTILKNEYIRYESDDEGRMDSVFFMGLAFNPKNKERVSMASVILGSSRVLTDGLIHACERTDKSHSDFANVIMDAAFPMMKEQILEKLKSFPHVEVVANNDEGTGGQQ